MNIHQTINQARLAKGWSMERLAEEVSRLEGLKKPLAWQTVQQWENGNSAPKRKRLAIVLQALSIDPAATTTSEPYSPTAPGQALKAEDTPRAQSNPVKNGANIGASVKALLIELGSILLQQDVAVRDATASLVAHLCRHPEDAATLASRISALLSVPGNIEAQRSTNSPTSRIA